MLPDITSALKFFLFKRIIFVLNEIERRNVYDGGSKAFPKSD